MKLADFPIIPRDPDQLQRALSALFRDIATAVNQLSEGRLYASYNAVQSAPTAGDYVIGDFVKNSAPTEAGTVGSKYVLLGWVCTSSSPLAFKECRVLTGG